jgi:hypothetical protein
LESVGDLWLTGNQIQALPDSFGNLSSLQYLFLNENQLTHLPKSFGNLRALQWLDLRNNHLQSLPESFGNLESLEGLDLSGNLIKDFPRSFEKLWRLKSLNFSPDELPEANDPAYWINHMGKTFLDLLLALPNLKHISYKDHQGTRDSLSGYRAQLQSIKKNMPPFIMFLYP